MRRTRLGAFGAICVVAAVAAATGVATADATPSATATQAFVAGSPTAIACDKSVDATVTVTGSPGTTGQATDVVIVVDLSGSTGSPASKLQNLKDAATATLDALDAADGNADHTITGNAVGLIYYHGAAATTAAGIGSTYGAVETAIAHLPMPSGGSPHDVGITAGSAALAASGNPGKALVLISDGQADGAALTAATDAADAARTSGTRIETFGLGTGKDVSTTNLTSWAYAPDDYQAATPGPISQTKLVADLDALVVTPVSFTLTEALGSTFSAAALSNSTGTVTTAPGTLQWQGTLTGSSATMTYRATRNGSDVFSSTTELVSTMSLAVTGGTASVTPPASLSIGVLPCGGSLVAATTCTGALCTASGTSGGETFTVSAGNAPAGTSLIVAGLDTQPPAGACPGFDTSTNGIEFDISPFTRDATFQYTVPKAALGNRKWWQLAVCLGTNLRFTTAINSLANLRPGARLVGGGTLPSRWWGLLPSIPRFTYIQGLGFVRGPYVSSRSQDRAGNATVTFVVPFVPGSAAFTTDGKPGYDPKRWG